MPTPFNNLIFLSLLVASVSTHAMEYRLIRCGKLLVTESHNHSVPSMSRDFTAAGLQVLNRFRAENLRAFNFEPSQIAIQADATSSQSVLADLTGRISGLLDEGTQQLTQTADGQVGRQILVSSVYDGHENIFESLTARHDVGEETRVSHKLLIAIEDFLMMVERPTMLGATLLMGYLSAVAPNPITPLLALGLRNEIENSLRTFLTPYFHFKQTEEKALLSRLQKLEPGEWHYRSFDEEVPIQVLRDIWRTRMISAMSLGTYKDWLGFPRWTVQHLGRRLYIREPRFRVEGLTPGWVRVDQLMRIDPQTQKPQLVVVVRLTEQLPPYPRHATVPRFLPETNRPIEAY